MCILFISENFRALRFSSLGVFETLSGKYEDDSTIFVKRPAGDRLPELLQLFIKWYGR